MMLIILMMTLIVIITLFHATVSLSNLDIVRLKRFSESKLTKSIYEILLLYMYLYKSLFYLVYNKIGSYTLIENV